MNRLFSILIFAGLGIILSGCMKQAPVVSTKNETANTNQSTSTLQATKEDGVYKNIKYGFEISYPKEWVVVIEGGDQVILGQSKNEDADAIDITVLEDKDNLSINEWVNHQRQQNNDNFKKISNIEFNSIKAVVFGTEKNVVQFTDPQRKYIFSISNGSGSMSQKLMDSKSFEKIYSSFKFIK